jgi:hypothetical protein
MRPATSLVYVTDIGGRLRPATTSFAVEGSHSLAWPVALPDGEVSQEAGRLLLASVHG